MRVSDRGMYRGDSRDPDNRPEGSDPATPCLVALVGMLSRKDVDRNANHNDEAGGRND